MSRKYQSYLIEVNFHNGNKEKIDMFNSTDINCESYKEMLKVYAEIKEKYKNDNCNINFCGSSEDGCLDVMFTKEIKNEVHIQEVVEESDKPSKTLLEVMTELELLLETTRERRKNIGLLEGAITKKQDVIHHQAEHAKENKMTDEEKLKAYNELIEVQILRRQVKEEIKISDIISSGNLIKELSDVVTAINNEKLNMHYAKSKGVEKYSTGLANEKVIRQVKYENFKQRINLMKQLQPKYDKVAIDDVNMVLICYNKCYK